MKIFKKHPSEEAISEASPDSYTYREIFNECKQLGDKFLTFSHMHEKDLLKRDRIAYQAAYARHKAYFNCFENLYSSSRIIFTISDAQDFDHDADLLRLALKEWRK